MISMAASVMCVAWAWADPSVVHEGVSVGGGGRSVGVEHGSKPNTGHLLPGACMGTHVIKDSVDS